MSAVRSHVMPSARRPTESPLTRTVPFDYVVTVPVSGEPGRLRQSLVNISTVGPFVVTGIGYSLLVDERRVPARFGPATDDGSAAASTLSFAPAPSVAPPQAPPVVVNVAAADTPATPTGFRIFGAPGSQVQLVLNGQPVAAGRGRLPQLDAGGRLQVELPSNRLSGRDTLAVLDITNGRAGPAVVLLGVDGPPPVAATPQFGPLAPALGATRFELVGTPGAALEVAVRGPADRRQPRLALAVKIPPSDVPEEGVEAGIASADLAQAKPRRKDEPLALVAGDVVVVRDTATNLSATFQVSASPLDVSLRALPAFALRQGFRVTPALLARLENEVPPPPGELANAFEACGTAPRELSFLYSIIDNGTGRALQSEPIHNVAGLGIADGDRPFRTFPKPIVLDPRSVLLFQIQEISGGPGTLYFVLQGYKVVGASPLRLPGSE